MIIFLYGEDGFRSRLKLNELKAKYLKEVDKLGSGLSSIAGAKADLAEIASAISSSSLLNTKRLVIIEDIFLNKDKEIFEKLTAYFKKRQSDDNIIIFWDSGLKIKKVKNTAQPFLLDASGREKALLKKQVELFKFLSGQKYAYAFNRLSNLELVNWVKKESEARGGRINNKAAELLVGLTNADTWQISQELDKLISFKAAGSLTGSAEIEIADINNLTRGSFSENIFALTDALGAKNKALAIKLLAEQVEAGLSDGYLLNMIIRQFKILLQLKQASGANSRQLAGKLKLHPFVAQKGAEQARNFTLPVLKNILSRLIEIDYKVKTGQGDYLTGLNMLIASL